MSISGNKEQIRQMLLEKRRALDEDEYTSASEEITKKIRQEPRFRQANILHCYISMNERKEVNTHPLIRELLQESKRIVVPITKFNTLDLNHVELTSFEDLEKNRWGVPEPEEGEVVNISELDLVLVPMAGGDAECNRIGYGKGFYDRFLAEVDCTKIGLCFEACIVEEIPTEAFDVRLDAIVTEERIIECFN